MSNAKQINPAVAANQVGAHKFPLLYSPIKIGVLKVPNRYVVPALTTNFAEADGSVGPGLLGYLSARSYGGYGLVMTENIGVHPSGRVMPRMIMADDDRYLPGLSQLAQSVKKGGCVLFAQLSHAGRQTRQKITGMQIVAPSAVACPLNKEVPQELSLDGIRAMEQAFVDAAVRVSKAGFDGIEIHGAHGYLVGGFLSRYSNKRTDEYGGSLANRMRFLLNIIAGIQAALGKDFPISVRISACEFVQDGLDVEESTQIGLRLKEAGIHLLSISVGVYESFNQVSMITGEPEGQWLELAGQLRARLAPLPVVGVGRIKRPEVAEQALSSGLLDLAAFGRASIADPGLPNKVLEGRPEEIIACFGCNVCLGRSSRPETICPVNPAVGREYSFKLQASDNPRQIRIVGSSVAALTAAWIAAARGHRVSIDKCGLPLGGMQAWRSKVPGQEEYAEMLQSVEHRALQAGATYDDTIPPAGALIWRSHCFQPQAVLQQTGGIQVLNAYEVLAGKHSLQAGERVVAFGPDLETAEAAILLAQAGCKLDVYIPGSWVAVNSHPGYRVASKRLIEKFGASLHTRCAGLGELDLTGAKALLLGYPAELPAYEDPDQWRMPEQVQNAYAASGTNALLGDAYEPGLMTRGVYEAVDIALQV